MKTLLTVCMGIILLLCLTCCGESQQASPVTFEININDLVGGGHEGEVDIDLINSKGEVFNVYAASYRDYGPAGPGEKNKPLYPGKKLVKTVDKKTIAVLGKALVEADIWNISTPGAGNGGREWTITIDGRTKTLGFRQLPKKLEKVDRIIRKILAE